MSYLAAASLVNTGVLLPTASWLSAAESNRYSRGQVVSLQVSAKIRPNQQVFIQSCFVSVSPEPQAKPRLTVIFNRGQVFKYLFVMCNLLVA